ncbi:MAG: hypothetical protein ACI8QZ_002078 [Chlamydiales bacterium]|jgi:hypothetical protein
MFKRLLLLASAGLLVLSFDPAAASAPTAGRILAEQPQLASQDPATPPQGPAFVLLDGVAAVIGDEIVTYGEIEYLRQDQASQGRTVERGEILDLRVRELLKAQGGRTLVVDRELVQLQLDSRWKDEVERQGGATKMSESLASAGYTPKRLRNYWRDGIYAQVWESSVTGAGVGSAGRPVVDRYIRPGQALGFHRILARSANPLDRARVGGRPAQAVIQQLVLPVSEYGGLDDTRTFGRELAQLASSGGSDFGDLVARYGARGNRETRGQGAPISMEDMEQLSVTRHRSRALLDFVDETDPGGISEPILGWKLGSDVQAIFVYKLIERLPPREAKPYTDPEVQKELERELMAQFDKVRVDIALQEAFRSSFSWTAGQGQPQDEEPTEPEPSAAPGTD